LVAHQLTDLSLGRHIQAWPLTASVRLGGNGTSGAMAAQQLLNKGKADPKDVGENALRANPSLVGVQDFLSQINRIASHARYASGIAPYDQEKTALVPDVCLDYESKTTTGTLYYECKRCGQLTKTYRKIKRHLRGCGTDK
jgi:hypothetical protein